ncbi:MAG: SDR family oxidoreductase [Solirubrobacteraceae bacterium]|nr:SDR family oxidoreductase [Solirubrobacteraceae bacterium]
MSNDTNEFVAPSSALVTGGAGFIGSHLVRRLVKMGTTVRVLDNLSTGRIANLDEVISDVEFHEGDLRSPEAVSQAVNGVEVVFHEAALPSVPRSVRDPRTSLDCNVTGTLNVLIAARDTGVRRVVFASSSSVYGSNPTMPKVETLVPAPISPYAVGKLAGEGLCKSFAEVYDVETVALRYFNVFGPYQDPASQYSAVIPRFIAALLNDEAPHIHGDGEQSRDFTYIDNVVNANLLAAQGPQEAVGKAFNAACGYRTTLNELVEEIAKALDVEPRSVFGPTREGDVRHSLADIGSAREILGFEPTVDLAAGLKETVEHYRDAGVSAPA